MQGSFFSKEQWPSLLLRAGLAFVFIYVSIAAFITPDNWVGFLPQMVTKHYSATTLLDIFGVFQLALAAWLLSGIYVKYAAWLTVLVLGGIIVSTPSQFLITFRDVGLLFAALALSFMPEPKN